MTHWTEQARCKGTPSYWWFDAKFYDWARPVCEACPVRGDCLTDVMEWERANGLHTKRLGFVAGLHAKDRDDLERQYRETIGGYPRDCHQCETGFVAPTPEHRYCSDECKLAARRNARRRHMQEVRAS
jgi:hypothetical protein